jgi:hypothetical protein
MESSMPEPSSTEPNGNSQETSQNHSNGDTPNLKKALAETRNTREVLMNFRAAIESGTFLGIKAVPLAHGLAFLDAVIMQSQSQIANLQKIHAEGAD